MDELVINLDKNDKKLKKVSEYISKITEFKEMKIFI